MPRSETLVSYSLRHETRSHVMRPRSRDELFELVHAARRAGRALVARGAGLSFDSQAMGGELALDLGALDEISIDAASRQVTLGGGARWGDVLRATLPEGLAPPVVVTTREATVAGTLSSNGLSRFSTLHGKEGRSILSLELLDVEGRVHQCSREENAELFHAVVGGFGALGLVLRATYRLERVGRTPRVRTRVELRPSLDGLAPILRASAEGRSDEAVYGVLTQRGGGARAIVCHARNVDGEPLRPMLPHLPSTWLRTPLEWLLHFAPPAGPAFWDFAYDHYLSEKRPYVDELADFTFMMDGNVRARRAAMRVGLPFGTIQQSYLLPSSAPGGTGDTLEPFLGEVFARLGAMKPAVIDVLHLAADEGFLLSSTRGLAGHVLTLTFEGLTGRRLGAIEPALVDLSDACGRFGGRVHLTKNVIARPACLEAMYAEALEPFFAQKKRLDPGGLLRSDFLGRIFPSFARRRLPSTTPCTGARESPQAG